MQPYVPRYRTAFYTRSREALAATGVDMRVVVGRKDSDRHDGDETFDAQLRRDRLEARFAGALRWRDLRGLSLANTDLLLLEQAIKNLDTYPALIHQALGGPSVGLWGHGRSYSSTQNSAMAWWKQFITRRCDWFFAYTPSGAATVVRQGFPAARTSVLDNTIDSDALSQDLATISDADVAAWARSLTIDPRFTALFLGGVDGRKDIDFLVAVTRAAAQMDPRFVMLFAGSGTAVEQLREHQSAGLPLRVLGRVDGHAKAMALRGSTLLAIPSQLGLVVIDSFVGRVPIVTRRNHLHGPEAEYLTNGSDSDWLAEDVSAQDYAARLVALMNDGIAVADLRQGCSNKAPLYSMDRMVEAFVEGVTSWAEVRRFGL